MYQRLKDLREDHDLTQEGLGRTIGVPQRTYSYYENGERAVPVEVLIQLARFYNVSIDYLLGETDNPKRYE